MKTLPKHRSASHLTSRDERDISFADIRRLPEPDWSRPVDAHAGVPSRLLRSVRPSAVRLDAPVVESEAAARRAADEIEHNLTVIAAMLAAAPFARHEDAFALVVAPLASMLSEVAL